MTDLLNVPITFNSVSVGKEQVSVGIGIDRERVDRDQMGELFVNSRLEVEMGTAESGERNLPGIENDRVQIFGAFDSTSYSEKEGSFTTRLKTAKSAVEPQDFWNLSGRDGRLVVKSSESQDGEGPISWPLPGQRELPREEEEAEDEEPDADVRTRPIDADNARPVGEDEEFPIPIPENLKHSASLFAQPLEAGYWEGGCRWEGEGASGGRVGTIVRNTREDALAAAAGQVIDQMQAAETPKSKAGQKRRADAIKVVKTVYGDLERGNQTAFETHPAEVA